MRVGPVHVGRQGNGRIALRFRLSFGLLLKPCPDTAHSHRMVTTIAWITTSGGFSSAGRPKARRNPQFGHLKPQPRRRESGLRQPVHIVWQALALKSCNPTARAVGLPPADPCSRSFECEAGRPRSLAARQSPSVSNWGARFSTNARIPSRALSDRKICRCVRYS